MYFNFVQPDNETIGSAWARTTVRLEQVGQGASLQLQRCDQITPVARGRQKRVFRVQSGQKGLCNSSRLTGTEGLIDHVAALPQVQPKSEQ